MALQLLLGAAGSGKTTELLETLTAHALAHPEESHLLLVPEQFCLSTQRRLVEMHPRHALLNIEALSFDRLAFRVFREFSAEDSLILSDTAKNILLSLAAKDCEDKLNVYRKQISRPGFLSKLGSLFAEWDMNDIPPERLRELAEEEGLTPLLKQKLRELSAVYAAFKLRLGEGRATAEETMPRLSRLLPRSEVGRADRIYLDGFTGFTSVQYRILTTLLTRCKEMTAAVTIPPGEAQNKRPDALFSMSGEMIRRLTKCAEEAGKKTVLLQTRGRAGAARMEERADLAFLEAHILRQSGPADFAEEPPHIRLYSCRDAEAEAARCTAEISRLLRQEGCRCRDIGVVVGDQARYGPLLERHFTENGIPFFTDRREPLARHPYIRLLEAALETVAEGFERDAFLRYLKNPCGPLAREECDRFENYLLAAGIRRGRQFTQPFERRSAKKRGESSEEWKERTDAELADMEALRIRATEALLTLRQNIKTSGTAQAGVQALQDFLTETGAAEKLDHFEEELKAQGWEAAAEENAGVREAVDTLLTDMKDLLGESRFTRRELADLLSAGLAVLSAGRLPSGPDEVMIGDVERSRFGNIRVLIILGLNEGLIPAERNGGGLLTDNERAALEAYETELGYTDEKALLEERFYLYGLLGKPTEQLIISYSRMGGDGRALLPSRLIREIKALFPGLQEKDGDAYSPSDALIGRLSALRALARGTGDSVRLRACLAEDPADRSYLELIRAGRQFSYKGKALPEELADRLYGKDLSGSVTRLERFAECPFRHFLDYGLQLEEREEFSWEASDHGSFFHKVMEEIGLELRAERLSAADLNEEGRTRLVKKALEKAAVSSEFSLEAREGRAYYLDRWERFFKDYLLSAGELQAENHFVPAVFEYHFDADKNPALRIPLDGSHTLRLNGTVDRIDLMDTENARYYRIIDYKTGSGNVFDYRRLMSGELLQLPLYLNTAGQLSPVSSDGKEVKPGGMYYAALTENWIDWKEEKERQKTRNAGYKLKGVTAEEVRAESTDASTQRQKSEKKKDDKGEKEEEPDIVVIPSETLERVGAYARGKAAALGKEILKGKIAAEPAERKNDSACTYCQYRAVCRFDKRLPGFRTKTAETESAVAAYQQITAGRDDHGVQ